MTLWSFQHFSISLSTALKNSVANRHIGRLYRWRWWGEGAIKIKSKRSDTFLLCKVALIFKPFASYFSLLVPQFNDTVAGNYADEYLVQKLLKKIQNITRTLRITWPFQPSLIRSRPEKKPGIFWVFFATRYREFIFPQFKSHLFENVRYRFWISIYSAFPAIMKTSTPQNPLRPIKNI